MASKRKREEGEPAVLPESWIKDASLAGEGMVQISLAEREMGAVLKVAERFAEERPLAGLRVAANLHVTRETAVLVRCLVRGGATVGLTGCNNMSTRDPVAAALASEDGVWVTAQHGCSVEEYYASIAKLVAFRPHVVIDDGCDLNVAVHADPEAVAVARGGTEQTTSGVIRLRNMERDKMLRYPVVEVNSSRTKHLLDNYYGCANSVLDGVVRASNIFLTGKTIVVVGYGPVGQGTALRARSFAASVIVTEVDPFLALRAKYDGHDVAPLRDALPRADVVVTCTGNKHVVPADSVVALAKDGAILCNAGQFDNEIDVAGLFERSTSRRTVRPGMEELTFSSSGDGKDKSVFVLGGGNLVNLACAEGHPSAVMATSFAGQALAAELIAKGGLGNECVRLPHEIDQNIASLQLAAMGVEIDTLTSEQESWLSNWKDGTA